MDDRPEALREVLQRHVLRSMQAGTLRTGDRLPSARELAPEFGVDHRVIVAAYRELQADGLVELRPRGGVYVAAGLSGERPLPSVSWVTDLYMQAVARGIPIPELPDWLFRSIASRRLRAVIVAGTADQAAGLCRELQDDFGLETSALPRMEPGTDAVGATDAMGADDAAIRRADLLVTTGAYEVEVRRVGDRLAKPVIVATVRPDLIDGEWRLLLRRPIHVIVADPRFGVLLRQFVDNTAGADNLHIVPATPEAVRAIPEDAATYVTRGARERLDGVPIPGRILPPARVLSQETTREIVTFIVTANLAAFVQGPPRRPER